MNINMIFAGFVWTLKYLYFSTTTMDHTSLDADCGGKDI